MQCGKWSHFVKANQSKWCRVHRELVRSSFGLHLGIPWHPHCTSGMYAHQYNNTCTSTINTRVHRSTTTVLLYHISYTYPVPHSLYYRCDVLGGMFCSTVSGTWFSRLLSAAHLEHFDRCPYHIIATRVEGGELFSHEAVAIIHPCLKQLYKYSLTDRMQQTDQQ